MHAVILDYLQESLLQHPAIHARRKSTYLELTDVPASPYSTFRHHFLHCDVVILVECQPDWILLNTLKSRRGAKSQKTFPYEDPIALDLIIKRVINTFNGLRDDSTI